MALFIRVTLDETACSGSGRCLSLVSACPVDIFTQDGDRVAIDEEQVDECTLCGLCLEAEPAAVKIEKLY